MIQLFGNIEHKRERGGESEGEEERERKRGDSTDIKRQNTYVE